MLRPLPRCRLGGSDHPPPRVGDVGVALGDGVERRGVRRLARHRPRRHRGDRVRGMDHRQRSDQKNHRRVDIERVNEREKDGYTGNTAEAGQDTDDRAGQHTGHEDTQMRRTRKPLQSD